MAERSILTEARELKELQESQEFIGSLRYKGLDLQAGGLFSVGLNLLPRRPRNCSGLPAISVIGGVRWLSVC